jgi:hypothetical protein
MAPDSGEEDQNRFAEADRLEAGGFEPFDGKNRSSTAVGVYARRLLGYTHNDEPEDCLIQKFRARFFWVCNFENRDPSGRIPSFSGGCASVNCRRLGKPIVERQPPWR